MTFVGVLAALTLLFGQGCLSWSDEKRLITSLTKQYEQVGLYGRPVVNISDQVPVYFGLGLIDAIPVAETRYAVTMQLNTWRRYQWSDVLLSWNPADYGGITTLRIPVSKMWKPDIRDYYVSPGAEVGGEALTVVHNTGAVLWIPPWQSQVICPKTATGDTFTCELKFGSWAYDGSQVDVQLYNGLAAIDLQDYRPNLSAFAIVENSGRRVVTKYPCCDEDFIDLRYTFKLQRGGSADRQTEALRQKLMSKKKQ